MSEYHSFFDDPPKPKTKTTSREVGKVVCPHCGLSQPLALDCVGCGKVLESRPAAPQQRSFLDSVLDEPAPKPPEPPRGAAALPPELRITDLPRVHAPEPEPVAPGDLYDESLYQHTTVRQNGGTSFNPLPGALGIMGETLSILAKQFIGYLAISALAMTPAFVIVALADLQTPALENLQGEDAAAAAVPLIMMALVVFPLCSVIATTAVTCGVSHEMRGRKATIVDSLATGLGALLPASLVMLVQAIIVGLVAILWFFATIAILPLFMGLGVGSPVAILLIILGGLLMIRVAATFAVTIPATVAERPGVFGALKRSYSLTSGAEWMVVRFYVLLAVGGFVIFIATVALAALLEGTGAENILGWVGNAVNTALFAAGSAVLYYRLRSVEEGIAVEGLESVFD